MTYPETPGYQKNSQTSKDASESIDAGTLREIVFNRIYSRYKDGLTGDELSKALDVIPGTISARLIELEETGRVYKTIYTRETRRGRSATVYIASNHLDQFDRSEIIFNKKGNISQKLNIQIRKCFKNINAIVARGNELGLKIDDNSTATYLISIITNNEDSIGNLFEENIASKD